MIHEVETGRGYSEITKPTSGQSPRRHSMSALISPHCRLSCLIYVNVSRACIAIRVLSMNNVR